MPASVLALVVVVIGIFPLFGCVSTNAPASRIAGMGDVVTVERSKAKPPSWAEGEAGHLVESDKEFSLITVRTKLLNLPLGLKQTQLGAIEAMRAALAGEVRVRLLAAAAAKGIAAPAGPGLDAVLRAATDADAGDDVRVADLYFETLEDQGAVGGDPMAHYYAAYVLVTFAKDRLPLIYQGLSRRLTQDSDPAVRRLAPVAKALAGAP